MTLDDLPDLTEWLNVEIWTIEEAAMLWASIDPYDFPGTRLVEIKSLVRLTQHRKATICQRAALEAVCAGTLPFAKAIEMHDSFNGDWEKEVAFPDLPDPDKLIPHKTRITQAAFRKWAKSKNIHSYRSLILRSAPKNAVNEATTVAYVESPPQAVPLLAAPLPAYMDPNHPMSADELRAGHDAWYAVTKDGDPRASGQAIRAAIRKYLDEHPEYGLFSNAAKERICTSANWNPKGGATPTPT